jgi:BNR/Asp-box repeat
MNDYLDQVEAQLTELTERGAHQRLRARRPIPGGGGPRPPRRRSEALALLAAAAVAVAVVAIVVFNVGTGKPNRTAAPAASSAQRSRTTASTARRAPSTQAIGPTTSSSTSSSTPLPSRFYPQSFTAISELTWWLLGTVPCPAGQGGPCAGILQTTDGGRTFASLSTPPAPASTYSQVRFADAHDGFAYGPDLYATHDGGKTWSAVDVGGRVADLATSDGQAYAIVTTTAGGSGRLIRSPVGQDHWTAVSAAGEVSGGLWVQGANVLVQSGSDGPGPNLLVSHDAGSTFATYRVPSPGLPCEFEGAASPDVWAHCVTGTESGVWLSHDGGASFAPAYASPTQPPQPNSAAFGAASGTVAVVGYQHLYRTGDAGQTWNPVGPFGIAQWVYVAFTDPTHGVALGYVGQVAPADERLYYTTDAGQTYHLVALP